MVDECYWGSLDGTEWDTVVKWLESWTVIQRDGGFESAAARQWFGTGSTSVTNLCNFIHPTLPVSFRNIGPFFLVSGEVKDSMQG